MVAIRHTREVTLRRRLEGTRRGSALIASLMVVIVVAGLGLCMLRLHDSAARRQAHAIDKKRAFYVAEAGLSEAFLAVSQGKSGNVATSDLPAAFGDGVYWVEATELDSGNVALVSTGLCGVGRFSISAVLRTRVDPVASLGVFSRGLLEIESGTVIDGYDSRAGTFESQVEGGDPRGHTTGGGLVSSNSDIVIESDVHPGELGVELPGMTIVFGDARPGPNSAVQMEPGALVTGSTAPRSNSAHMPSIDVPLLTSQGDLDLRGATPYVLATSVARYDVVRVRAGAELQLQGPLHIVIGGLVLEPGARLVIDTTAGPVSIFCTDYLHLEHDSMLVNTGGDPAQVSLLVTAEKWIDRNGDGVPDPPVRIRSGGAFYGLLYAPEAPVSIPSTLRFFGAVAAFRLQMLAGARLTVDRALAESDAGLGSLPRLVAWEIVALPDAPLVNTRVDPRTLLNLAGLAPPPSATAHAEQFLDIAFFDVGGVYRTYSGPESAFDWDTVGTLISVQWDDEP